MFTRSETYLGIHRRIRRGSSAVVMPLAYLLRSTVFYRRGIMPWGSSAIACLALVWFVQRAVL
jgi:hypothetical protein